MKDQFILQHLEKPDKQIAINTKGVLVRSVFFLIFKRGNHQKKKVYEYDHLSFNIARIEKIPSSDDFRFVVSFSNGKDKETFKGEVVGHEQMEEVMMLVGKFIYIRGMQRLIEDSFKVGQGSFCKIYLIRTHYGKKSALKTFDKKTVNAKERDYEIFLNELKIMRCLKSANLLSLDYVFQNEKGYHAKIQYFKKSFKNRICEKLSRKQQKDMLKQLMQGLLQMKKQNIIHRDLKPENIMIRDKPNNEQECVIIDFGLATVASSTPYFYTRCGTPGFISPEIANLRNKHEKQSITSDMFSLGCIFYKMISGCYLFNGSSANQILSNNRKLNYTSYYFNKMQENERDILQRMLERFPQKRITPQLALSHPYFNRQFDDQDEIAEEQHQLGSKMKRINHYNVIKNMESLISSSITMQEPSLMENTANSCASPLKLYKVKDSCATFDFQIKASSNKENDDELDISFSKIQENSYSKENQSRLRKTTKQSNFKPLKIITNNQK